MITRFSTLCLLTLVLVAGCAEETKPTAETTTPAAGTAAKPEPGAKGANTPTPAKAQQKMLD